MARIPCTVCGEKTPAGTGGRRAGSGKGNQLAVGQDGVGRASWTRLTRCRGRRTWWPVRWAASSSQGRRRPVTRRESRGWAAGRKPTLSNISHISLGGKPRRRSGADIEDPLMTWRRSGRRGVGVGNGGIADGQPAGAQSDDRIEADPALSSARAAVNGFITEPGLKVSVRRGCATGRRRGVRDCWGCRSAN